MTPPRRHQQGPRPPLQRNAANRQQRDFAERKERVRRDQFVGSLQAVMATPEGRRVFGELLEMAGLWRTSYDNSGSATYFNEGRRNFGLEIKAMLEDAGEDLYLEMEREMRHLRRSLDNEALAVQQASTPAPDDAEGQNQDG